MTEEKIEVIHLADSYGKDELYCRWYSCSCGGGNITAYFKHCPDCGVKLKMVGEEPD